MYVSWRADHGQPPRWSNRAEDLASGLTRGPNTVYALQGLNPAAMETAWHAHRTRPRHRYGTLADTGASVIADILNAGGAGLSPHPLRGLLYGARAYCSTRDIERACEQRCAAGKGNRNIYWKR